MVGPRTQETEGSAKKHSNVPIMSNPVKELAAKWKRLTMQYGFRRAPVLAVSRLISWRAKCSLQKMAIVKFHKLDLQLLLPVKWEGIGRSIFAFREHYEPELAFLQHVLSPGATFVDVGANLGIYTLMAGRIVGHLGRVIAFEPSAQSFPLLRQNIELNHLTNVHAFPVALSEKTGETLLYHAPCPSGNSLGKDPSFNGNCEVVVTESLDNIVQEVSVERVDVIKMDVQGAEELVLRGAQKVAASMKPVIIFEFYPEGAALLGLSPYGAWELLERLGYDFFAVCSAGTISRMKSPPTDTKYANVVAIHKKLN